MTKADKLRNLSADWIGTKEPGVHVRRFPKSRSHRHYSHHFGDVWLIANLSMTSDHFSLSQQSSDDGTMRMIDKITAIDENGNGFALTIQGLTSFGDLRVSFGFELQWARGYFEFVASEQGIRQFEHAIVALNEGNSDLFAYMNDESNLAVTVKPTGRGDAMIEIIAIPNMANDDRIEFEITGLLSCTQ